MPELPTIGNKLCCCFEIQDGLKCGSGVLAVLYSLTLLLLPFHDADSSTYAEKVIGMIWCICCITVYSLLYYSISKEIFKGNYVMAALVASVFNTLSLAATSVVKLVFFDFSSAIIGMILAGLTGYYCLALNSFYKNLNSGTGTNESSNNKV